MCEESGFFCGSVHPFICQRTRQGPIPCTALQSDLMSINVRGTVETEKNVRQGMTAALQAPGTEEFDLISDTRRVGKSTDHDRSLVVTWANVPGTGNTISQNKQ